MPKAPSYIDKVNTIVRFAQNPCDAPWIVYAELALPALGEAVLSLLEFDFGDVVRGALRPKGLRSKRHGRRGRKGKLSKFAIPEIGELIGSNIPGAEAAKGRHVTQGVKHLWILDGVLQRILWYWLVVDITLEFFYHWSTAVMKSEFCQAHHSGAAYSKEVAGTKFGSFGAWGHWPAFEQVYQTLPSFARGNNSNGGGTASLAIASISGTNNGLLDLTVGARISVNASIKDQTGPTTIPPGGSFSAVFSQELGPLDTAVPSLLVGGGVLDVECSIINIIQ